MKPAPLTNEEKTVEARLEGGREMNSLILPKLVQNRMRELIIDDKWSRIIYADGYPRSVSDGWLDKLVSMPGNFDMVIHIQPLDLNKVMRQLNHVEAARHRNQLVKPTIRHSSRVSVCVYNPAPLVVYH